MATYTTFSQVGQKEDVSDIISNIDPTDTPFISSVGTEKVSAKLYEWQEDSLRAVQVNAQVEGFTASDATLTPTVMRDNTTQILEKTVKISASADAIATYGRAKESAYQIAKAMKEVKRDLEHQIVGLQTAKTVGNSSTARKFASFTSMVDAGNFVYTGAAGTALDETDILAVSQELYEDGVDPKVMHITPRDSLVVATFAAASGRVRDIANAAKGDRTLVNAVDLYVSPFGDIKIYINRWLLETDSLIFDPDMWKLCVLRPWTRETLAKTGDNTTMMIVGEYGLKHKNYNASGVIRRAAAP